MFIWILIQQNVLNQGNITLKWDFLINPKLLNSLNLPNHLQNKNNSGKDNCIDIEFISVASQGLPKQDIWFSDKSRHVKSLRLAEKKERHCQLTCFRSVKNPMLLSKSPNNVKFEILFSERFKYINPWHSLISPRWQIPGT